MKVFFELFCLDALKFDFFYKTISVCSFYRVNSYFKCSESMCNIEIYNIKLQNFYFYCYWHNFYHFNSHDQL